MSDCRFGVSPVNYPAPDTEAGGVQSMFTSVSGRDDGFIPVRGNQSKRPRFSSGGQRGPIDQPPDNDEMSENDFEDL